MATFARFVLTVMTLPMTSLSACVECRPEDATSLLQLSSVVARPAHWDAGDHPRIPGNAEAATSLSLDATSTSEDRVADDTVSQFGRRRSRRGFKGLSRRRKMGRLWRKKMGRLLRRKMGRLMKRKMAKMWRGTSGRGLKKVSHKVGKVYLAWLKSMQAYVGWAAAQRDFNLTVSGVQKNLHPVPGPSNETVDKYMDQAEQTFSTGSGTDPKDPEVMQYALANARQEQLRKWLDSEQHNLTAAADQQQKVLVRGSTATGGDKQLPDMAGDGSKLLPDMSGGDSKALPDMAGGGSKPLPHLGGKGRFRGRKRRGGLFKRIKRKIRGHLRKIRGHFRRKRRGRRSKGRRR